MHTLKPGGEEGAQAKRTTAATGQHGSQEGVVGKHPVNQRGPLPVLPHHKSGNQFLGNKKYNNHKEVLSYIVNDNIVFCTLVALYLQ